MHARRSTIALLCAAALLLVSAGTAAAYTPLTSSEVVAKLNEFRVANGLPGGVVEQPALSAGCRAHNQWMQANRTVAHVEVPGTPFYSAAGNAAGATAILAQGPTWADAMPWLNAPIHLSDALEPGMVETGASEEFGSSCLATHTPLNLHPTQPLVDTFYGYPADGGSLPATQVAYESPAAPQTFGVNPIADGTATGPNLLTWYLGPQLAIAAPQLTSASLTGPGGAAVPVMTVDSQQLYLLSKGSGVIVPRAPLTPGATYTWTATYTAPGFTFTSAPRSFTTSGQKLCGNGAGGWFGACPWLFRSVVAPRTVRVGRLGRAIVVTISTDQPALAFVSAKVGRTSVARALTVTIGASTVGKANVRVTAAGVRLLRTQLKRRRSVVLAIEIQGGQVPRTMKVLVTR